MQKELQKLRKDDKVISKKSNNNKNGTNKQEKSGN